MSLEVMFGLGTGMAAHAYNKTKKLSSVFPVQVDTVHVQSKDGRPRRGQAGKIELAGSKGEKHCVQSRGRTETRAGDCGMSYYWSRGTRRAEQGEQWVPHEGVTW